MALTEIYVDPAIAADSGAGTEGSPYGDLEYAIEQETFDLTNGTRVNIKAGTDELLAADLSVAMADTGTSIAWVPVITSPLIFQGYTNAANDGGIGGISGGGLVSVIFSSTLDSVHLKDLHCHNTGSVSIIRLDNDCSAINCEIDNTTGSTAFGIHMDNQGFLFSCYIHNVGHQGLEGFSRGAFVGYNFFENISGFGKYAMFFSNGTAYRNIIRVSGGANGMRFTNGANILHNSIWSDGGTGTGVQAASNQRPGGVFNNIVEGFSGAGGAGFDLDAGTLAWLVFGGNAAYDNTTNYDGPTLPPHNDLGDNEILTESPFMDAANGDFRPRNVGNVFFGALPGGFHANAPTNIIQLHKGAVQLQPHPAPPRAWRH